MQQLIRQRQHSVLPFILLLILLVLLAVQLHGFRWMNAPNKGRTNLPVSIRASSQADYSRDADELVVPPVNENIFQQIMHDLQGIGSPADRVSTLESRLSQPVPSMTLNPQMPTPTLVLSMTGALGSMTPLGTISPQVTGTVITETLTGVPTHSLTPTMVDPMPTAAAPTSVPPPTKKPKPTPRPRPTRRP